MLPATWRMALICALPPTRLTEMSDVHCRPHAAIEQIRFQKDLTIGDGDDVGRDVGRDVSRLGFNDRQSGQRSAAIFVAHFASAFQQARVEIENVSGISFAAWRTAQQQRNFAV